MPTAWVLRIFGEDVNSLDLTGKEQNEGIVSIRSLVWPGAYTTFHRNQHFFAYFGRGDKATGSSIPRRTTTRSFTSTSKRRQMSSLFSPN